MSSALIRREPQGFEHVRQGPVRTRGGGSREAEVEDTLYLVFISSSRHGAPEALVISRALGPEQPFVIQIEPLSATPELMLMLPLSRAPQLVLG